jgi:NADPH-dependent glutamate synthase beta subunit-like oxidoreductase
MPAARQEIENVLQEGVKIRGSLAPVEVVLGSDGRAKALRVIEVDWISGKMQPRTGTQFDIACDLIVAAVGQTGDFTGMEEFDNGRGLMNSEATYRWPGRAGIFVGGDVLRIHRSFRRRSAGGQAAEDRRLSVQPAQRTTSARA